MMSRMHRPILWNGCSLILAAVVSIATFAHVGMAQTTDLRIAVIDLYGLNRIAASTVRESLTFKQGDSIVLAEERAPMFTESERHLRAIPGIAHVRFDTTCCDKGGAIVTVGIQERGSETLAFRKAPDGPARLAPDIVEAGDEFDRAMQAAVLRGDSVEDHTQGHALAHDPAARAIQAYFAVCADRDLQSLRNVLRTSADSEHRALAAYVLGYVHNKKGVVSDLVNAMNDPSDQVRNNASRTLWVFADATSAIPVPYEPFVKLHSPVWSDRNKASLALMALSDKRDPKLFELLRRRALGPLVEIARWDSEGHALPGFILLSRMAGYSDTEAHRLWETGQRESVISAASIQH
jgi:hypothetical protein